VENALERLQQKQRKSQNLVTNALHVREVQCAEMRLAYGAAKNARLSTPQEPTNSEAKNRIFQIIMI